MLLRALALSALAMLPLAACAENPALAASSSGFVRAQAMSGIRWQPWTEAVLARAKQQNKPVYVFIGSPLSELTRATINQTFTSEKTVAWINESFFCIFVDADTQPDVAALGQHFIISVKQLRGQPVHLWLTPDTLQPYDGANYLPPSEEWGKPGFLKAARAALDTWTVDPARARALATEGIDMMRLPRVDLSVQLDIEAKLDAATKAWVAAADPVHGGFGTAPKLPEPELIRFLLTRDAPAREAAINAARALVNGALRDTVDGGFYRRCIDEQWKEPYHQKLLVDQARIALALFDAADAAKDEKLRAAGIGALEFAIKELRNPWGKFAAGLDGTLAEHSETAVRPQFFRVGSASRTAFVQLIAAILRQESSGSASDVDLNTISAGTKWLSGLLAKDTSREQLTKALHQAILAKEYFDPVAGAYMATPEKLPPGITVQVPAFGETPSLEVQALLLGGLDAKTADLIRRNLMHQIEYDDLPPGDILLGLSQGQK